jgi:hypothetical protein
VNVGPPVIPHGGGEADSATQTSVPRPTATAPGQTRAVCGAWPPRVRCDVSKGHAEFPPRRSRGPRAHNPALPLSPAFAVQRLNRIDQRQCFLRVVPVGTGQPDGERHASRVTNQMTLAPSLGAIRGIWTRLRTAVHGRGLSSCQQLLGTNRCCLRWTANSGARSASDPRLLPFASRAGVASMSCQNHSPVLAATSAMVFRCAARTGCRSGRRDQTDAAARRSVAMVETAEAVRSVPTMRWATARPP